MQIFGTKICLSCYLIVRIIHKISIAVGIYYFLEKKIIKIQNNRSEIHPKSRSLQTKTEEVVTVIAIRVRNATMYFLPK